MASLSIFGAHPKLTIFIKSDKVAAKARDLVEVIKDGAAGEPWVVVVGRGVTLIVDHIRLQEPITPFSCQGFVYVVCV